MVIGESTEISLTTSAFLRVGYVDIHVVIRILCVDKSYSPIRLFVFIITKLILNLKCIGSWLS